MGMVEKKKVNCDALMQKKKTVGQRTEPLRIEKIGKVYRKRKPLEPQLGKKKRGGVKKK